MGPPLVFYINLFLYTVFLLFIVQHFENLFICRHSCFQYFALQALCAYEPVYNVRTRTQYVCGLLSHNY